VWAGGGGGGGGGGGRGGLRAGEGSERNALPGRKNDGDRVSLWGVKKSINGWRCGAMKGQTVGKRGGRGGWGGGGGEKKCTTYKSEHLSKLQAKKIRENMIFEQKKVFLSAPDNGAEDKGGTTVMRKGQPCKISN